MIFSTLILAISIFPRSTRVAISRLAALASASRFSRIILMRCIESLRCRNDRRVESYRANQLTRDVESLCCRRTGFGPDGGRKNVCSTFKRRYNSCLRPRGTPRNHVDSKPDVVQGQPSPTTGASGLAPSWLLTIFIQNCIYKKVAISVFTHSSYYYLRPRI